MRNPIAFFSRHFLPLLILLPLCLTSLPARADHTAEEAQAFIENLAHQAITTVAERQISDSERNERFRRLFVASFDLPEISRFVMARYWKTATPDQQQEFIKLFEEMQVLNWTRRFKDYKGENLAVTASSKDGDKGFTVNSLLNRAPTEPLPVQWRLHQGENGSLQITDIVVEGVSMVITQRSDYNALLQGNGGNVEALLSALRTKIDQMRAAG